MRFAQFSILVCTNKQNTRHQINLNSRIQKTHTPNNRINSHFSPLTSFSSRLSSTFTGSDPWSKFMNSSASRLGRTGARLLDDDPLNDAVAASGVVSLLALPPFSAKLGSEPSAMSDLAGYLTSNDDPAPRRHARTTRASNWIYTRI